MSCFHTQASLSRSVIGPAGQPGGGSKQIADYARVAGRLISWVASGHMRQLWGSRVHP